MAEFRKVATFKSTWGRIGTIEVGTAICDICGEEKNCLVVDGSEDEYESGAICLDCAQKELSGNEQRAEGGGLDISMLKVGDKVRYIPFNGCGVGSVEYGMVKKIQRGANAAVWVVYHCGGDWENFEYYPAELTGVDHLELGWKD